MREGVLFSGMARHAGLTGWCWRGGQFVFTRCRVSLTCCVGEGVSLCSPGVVSARLVLDRQGELERGQSLCSPGVVSAGLVVLDRGQSLCSPGVVSAGLVVLERVHCLCSPGVVSARLVVLDRDQSFCS